jgi:hypothetical protein
VYPCRVPVLFRRWTLVGIWHPGVLPRPVQSRGPCAPETRIVPSSLEGSRTQDLSTRTPSDKIWATTAPSHRLDVTTGTHLSESNGQESALFFGTRGVVSMLLHWPLPLQRKPNVDVVQQNWLYRNAHVTQRATFLCCGIQRWDLCYVASLAAVSQRKPNDDVVEQKWLRKGSHDQEGHL